MNKLVRLEEYTGWGLEGPQVSPGAVFPGSDILGAYTYSLAVLWGPCEVSLVSTAGGTEDLGLLPTFSTAHPLPPAPGNVMQMTSDSKDSCLTTSLPICPVSQDFTVTSVVFGIPGHA